MKIVVGTTSELKQRACKEALSRLGIDGEITSIKTNSSVSEQPFGYDEITKGARNRAKEALRLIEDAEISIGIENGLIKIDQINQWFDMPCVCILSKDGKEFFSFGTGYFIPEWMVEKVKNSNTDLGFIIQELDPEAEKDPIGYFSSGTFKREEILTQAIICALVEMSNLQNYLEK